jgi:hypothetical protein
MKGSGGRFEFGLRCATTLAADRDVEEAELTRIQETGTP